MSRAERWIFLILASLLIIPMGAMMGAVAALPCDWITRGANLVVLAAIMICGLVIFSDAAGEVAG